MSTATPPIPSSSFPSGRTGLPVRPSSPSPAGTGGGGGGGPPAGIANIDPIRLLRRYYPLLIGAAVVGAVLGAASHYVLLRVHPTYTAAVVFQCYPPQGRITEDRTSMGSQVDFDRFMGTELNQMESYEVMNDALKNPELQKTGWAQKFVVSGAFQPLKALPKLQDKVSPRVMSGTNLIRMSVSERTPNDARAIVQAVSKAYITSRQETTSVASAGRREVLNRRREDIGNQITLLINTRDTLLKDGRVTNLREGANLEEQKQSQISSDLVEVKQQQASAAKLLASLNEMSKSTGAKNYPDDMLQEAKQDPVVLDLIRQQSSLKVDEQSLMNQGIGDEHPTIIALRQRMKATDKEYKIQLDTVLEKLYSGRVADLRKSEDSLKARETQLTEELTATQTRKQELLKLLLKVEQLDDQRKSLEQELAAVIQSRENLELVTGNQVFDQVKIVMPAQTPTEVSFPKLLVMLPLGLVLMTGLTAGVILLREIMDQRVKGPADVAMIPRLKVLGMVPDAEEDPSKPASIETAFRDTPGGVMTESFRQIRAPLIKRMNNDHMRTVLVLAGMPGSGATTVASNLALAFAGSDENVLIIDANLRRPSMHRVFGVSDPMGLADCLAGETTLESAARPTSMPNLSVLTAGTAGNRMVPERLSSEVMSRLLAEAASRYDRVFVDCPPAIVSGDGMALASRCDGVLLVVRALSEKRGLVNRLRVQLAEAHGELIGVVVNAVKSSAGGYFKRNIEATHAYHNSAEAA